jgi:hypothetical protein
LDDFDFGFDFEDFPKDKELSVYATRNKTILAVGYVLC